jgi:hypothetical protein
MVDVKCIQKVLVGKPETNGPLSKPMRRWTIILKWILKKKGKLWIRVMWLRIVTGGEGAVVNMVTNLRTQ